MGKPIAGKNKNPYTIGGLRVDGALINGKQYINQLYVYQQRSDCIYDLIDVNGNIFEFIQLTWKNKSNTINLNYFDNNWYLINDISDNTFFIKAHDIREKKYGFVTLIHTNKIKIHTGEYIFYKSTMMNNNIFNFSITPEYVYGNVGDKITFDVICESEGSFDLGGEWYSTDNKTILLESNEQSATFECKEPGISNIMFVPNFNKVLARTSEIYINELIPTFIVVEGDARPIEFHRNSTYRELAYSYGDILTLSVFSEPYDEYPETELSVNYHPDIFEYLGTEDNINYKFKVISNTQKYETYYIEFDNGKYNNGAWVTLLPIVTSNNYVFNIIGPNSLRIGRPMQFKVMEKIGEGLVLNWFSSNPEVATIDSSGIVTPISSGVATIRASINSTDNPSGSGMFVFCDDGIPDKVLFNTLDKNLYDVGDTVQLEVQYIPSDIPVKGMFMPVESPTYSLSFRGLITVKAKEAFVSNINVLYSTAPHIAGHSGSVDDNQISLSLHIKNIDNNLDDPVGFNIDSKSSQFIPVNGYKRFYMSFNPEFPNIDSLYMRLEIEDESIVSIVMSDPNQNTHSMKEFLVYGLKVGRSKVTVIYEDDPSIREDFIFTVF